MGGGREEKVEIKKIEGLYAVFLCNGEMGKRVERKR